MFLSGWIPGEQETKPTAQTHEIHHKSTDQRWWPRPRTTGQEIRPLHSGTRGDHEPEGRSKGMRIRQPTTKILINSYYLSGSRSNIFRYPFYGKHCLLTWPFVYGNWLGIRCSFGNARQRECCHWFYFLQCFFFLGGVKFYFYFSLSRFHAHRGAQTHDPEIKSYRLYRLMQPGIPPFWLLQLLFSSWTLSYQSNNISSDVSVFPIWSPYFENALVHFQISTSNFGHTTLGKEQFTYK